MIQKKKLLHLYQKSLERMKGIEKPTKQKNRGKYKGEFLANVVKSEQSREIKKKLLQ